MQKPFQVYYPPDSNRISYLITLKHRLAMCTSYKAQRIRIRC